MSGSNGWPRQGMTDAAPDPWIASGRGRRGPLGAGPRWRPVLARKVLDSARHCLGWGLSRPSGPAAQHSTTQHRSSFLCRDLLSMCTCCTCSASLHRIQMRWHVPKQHFAQTWKVHGLAVWWPRCPGGTCACAVFCALNTTEHDGSDAVVILSPADSPVFVPSLLVYSIH